MRYPDTRKIDLDDDERLGEGDSDIRRHRADVRGRGDQLCDAAPRHKWRSEGWSTQAKGGIEGGATTSTAPWVRGGPWAWARSPEMCVRGAVSTLCGATQCKYQELVTVKVSILRNVQDIDRGRSHKKAPWQNGGAEQSLGTVFDSTAARTEARRHHVRSAKGSHRHQACDSPLRH